MRAPADRSAQADRLVEIDLATVEKLPVLARLLAGVQGPSLDLGSGLGYYARQLFAGPPSDRGPAIVADLDLSALSFAGRRVHPCQANALRLPFPDATFGAVLLADVLEHCPEDEPVLAEVARVLRPGGRLVLSVPSIEWGFADFLPFLGVASVHDQEGPERHYTEGYTHQGLAAKLRGAGLEVIEQKEILRLGPKLLLDGLALVHLLVEKLGPAKRTAWTWGTLVASPPPGLRLYRRLFPLVKGVRRGLEILSPRKGFELVAAARKPG